MGMSHLLGGLCRAQMAGERKDGAGVTPHPPRCIGAQCWVTLMGQLPLTSTGVRRVPIRLYNQRIWWGGFRPLYLPLFTLTQ